MLATLQRPTHGTLSVMGHDLPDKAMLVRPHLGYLGHDPLVYLDLTALQNLELFADLYGVPDPRERIEELLDQGISGRAPSCGTGAQAESNAVPAVAMSSSGRRENRIMI